MKHKSVLIILGIVILGFLLRIYDISRVSMYGDELTMVYDTYSLLKTGKDSTGKSFPVTFRMGAGRQGGYIYGSLPFVYMFGPTELGIRSLSVLSGLGIIILMYFLAKKLFNNEKIGLIASFLTSISMWDIYISRGGFEAHFALFLALLGVVSFLYQKYILTAIAWGIATLTYPTFKFTLPLMSLVVLWWQQDFKNLIKSKTFIVSLVILLFFGLVVANETFRSGSEARFSTINVFSDPNLKQKIVENITLERNFSALPKILKPIFYNRPTAIARTILENYLGNVSLNFLFLRGDGNPRHNPGEWGMFYLIELPLMIAGIAFLFKENKRMLIFLLGWVLIVPLATMLIGEPHALRNGFMLPPLILISAYSLLSIPKSLSRICVALMIIQLGFVLTTIYFLAPNKFSTFWSYPAKVAVENAIANKSKYDYIFISNNFDNAEFAYEVYAKVDPKVVTSQDQKFTRIEGYNFKKFDNVYIGEIPDDKAKNFLKDINGSVEFIVNYNSGRLETFYK